MRDGPSLPSTRQSTILSWSVAAVLIAVSTGVLGWMIGETGTGITQKDARHYYRSAISFAQGDGWGFPVYEIVSDSIAWIPLSHFPPGLSILYGSLIYLGIPPAQVPVVVNLVMWPILLVGLGLLAGRLARSATAIVWAVALGAITWPLINRFQLTESEVLFLPILVLLTYWLTDSQSRSRGWGWWCGLLILLTLLLQTRYVGIFLYGGVVVWWTITRWRYVTWRQLAVEWALLALPGLSLMAWSLRNWFLVGHWFGPAHLTESSYELQESIVGFIQHAAWLVLPSIRPGPFVRSLGWGPLAAYVVLLAMLGIWGWRYRSRWLWIGSPARSPLLALLVVYLAVFTVFKPFFLSYPMNERFMSVNLALIQPFLMAILFHAGPGSHGWRPGLFAISNSLLLAIVLWMAWGRPGAPYVPLPDPAGYPQESYALLLRGVPSWLIHNPPRTLDRQRYLPEVEAYLSDASDEPVIVSNAPELFTEYAIATGTDPLEQWLAEGRCTVTHSVFLVVVDWDRWAVGLRDIGWDVHGRLPQELSTAITAKCPNLQAIDLPRSTIYRLPNELIGD